MNQLKEIYKKEIQEFKGIGRRFIDGSISSAEFKGSSGGMGVYAQRGGKEFMIRLRVLSGVLDVRTLDLIRDMANDYSLKNIHLTTRQAIQLHDLQFDEVIDIMEKSLENDLYTRGGGGNFPRNVSLSPLSGVEIDEVFDVTSYAILVNQYFISKMNTYKLPRKFKVAFSNNSKDTANASIADLGFIATKQGDKNLFQVYIGGGLGANSEIGVPFDRLVDPADVLVHVQAALSLFVDEGDYENKGKARLRYILKRMGTEAFLACYKNHLKKIRDQQQPEFQYLNDYTVNMESKDKEEFIDTNVISQKQEGYYTVVIHPKGGLLETEDVNNIVDFLKKIPKVQIRLTMEESMLIRNLTVSQTKELLKMTAKLRQTTKLSQSVCCIGVPTCQIGVQESQVLLHNIISTFQSKGVNQNQLPPIHISGCQNSCARHQVSELGFHGKKKRVHDKVQNVYTLHIDGKVSQQHTHFARECGDLLATAIPEFLCELSLNIEEKNMDFKSYIKKHKEDLETILEKYLV